MKLVGVISGEVKPHHFEILLEEEIDQGSYVKVYHEQYGWVLCRVNNLKRFLDSEGEVMLGDASPVGYLQDDQVLIPRVPFKPQQKVYLADKELISQIIGLERQRQAGIYLGILEGHHLPVYLNSQRVTHKHLSVLAKTGTGKSYAVAVIIEELLKKKFPVVIIDPHGEYSSLKYENDDYDGMLNFNVKPHSYEQQIQEFAINIIVNPAAKKLTLRPKFSLRELIRVIPLSLNDRQKSILYDALKKLEDREYSLQDLINVVKLDTHPTKWKVVNGLETLRDSGVFEGIPVMEKDLVQEGKASIINLKGSEPEIQELVVGKISRDLFEAKKLNEIPNFFFLIEEAHNFCPERGFGDALSSQILRTIVSEGRKFGFYLGVVSQRPARVDKNVLSQCNTQIILKVTNPNDLRALSKSIEGFTYGMEDEIKGLSIGQALVVGDCVEYPIVVNVRTRESKHGPEKSKPQKKPPLKESKIVKKIKPLFLEEKVKKKEEPLLPDETKSKRKGFFGKVKGLFIEEK